VYQVLVIVEVLMAPVTGIRTVEPELPATGAAMSEASSEAARSDPMSVRERERDAD
jgi:hypothetical protein